MIELYYVSGSPYSWRVMLTAEVKGVPSFRRASIGRRNS